MFAGTKTPEPGEVNADAFTAPVFVKIKMLFVPGGPLPGVVMFVQFSAVDQLMPLPLAAVQSNVPGDATVLLFTTKFTNAVFVIPLPIAVTVSE